MEPNKKIYSQREVNKIFSHIPSKTLRWWAIRDLYGWANQVNDGRGIHREYELGNLYQIGIAEELSSLNIPVETINRIMRKHFLSGLVMYPIKANLDKHKLSGGTRVNVVDQMNKNLVITKTLSGTCQHFGSKRPPENESFLIENMKDEVILVVDELFLDSVKIIINLGRIKLYVNNLIDDLYGWRPNIPEDI
jgi:hypothetical protein